MAFGLAVTVLVGCGATDILVFTISFVFIVLM